MCGITALISLSGTNIINDLYESLYHLQHRGQDSFGFSFLSEEKIKCFLRVVRSGSPFRLNEYFYRIKCYALYYLNPAQNASLLP